VSFEARVIQGEYTSPHEHFHGVSDEVLAFVSALLSYGATYQDTAEEALAHPWLASNCDPQALQLAKEGSRGIYLQDDQPINEKFDEQQLPKLPFR
jgi:hypothetical protein